MSDLLGSLVKGAFDMIGQFGANKSNKNAAKRQMDFQERMSSTSYQRAVEDMRLAGLNPILAYSQGGASSPAGAMSHSENVGSAAGAGFASAAQGLAALSGAKTNQASADLMVAQKAKTESETMEHSANAFKLTTEIEKNWEEAMRHRQGTFQSKAQEDEIRAVIQNLKESTAGITADSASKYETYQAMRSGGGFKADVARRVAESKAAQFELPGRKAESDFFETEYGKMNPMLKQIYMILKGFSSARSAFGR